MKIETYPGRHLTYCTNIHPGEEWADIFVQLKEHLPELKRRLSPEASFGIGLRLSARAAEQLLANDRLDAFKNWLKKEDLYVFTMNGFPYGDFHGTVVKDKVYKPDWTSRDRVHYTRNLITILEELLPADMEGGISTSPLSYKYWGEDTLEDRRQKIFAKSITHLADLAARMAKIRESTGKWIHLDIEPEPDCLLENSEETVTFFEEWLFPKGSEYLADAHDYTVGQAQKILQDHIQLCYDTCHFAVEYESPSEALHRFKDAGVRIGKTQISAALKAQFDNRPQRNAVVERLRQFEETTYLHQVIEKEKDGTVRQYRDLPDAFDAKYDGNSKEWRIHYHVPIFVEAFEGLESTQDNIKRSLRQLLEETDCSHFEIETYTWSVLPDHLKRNMTESIEREFNWTLTQIGIISQASGNKKSEHA